MKLVKGVARVLGGGIVLLGIVGSGAQAAGDEAGAALTPEASWALSNAEAAVALAQSNGVLWTTAAAALAQAKEAAKKQDSVAVIAHAATASEQASLGMGQLAYPLMGRY